MITAAALDWNNIANFRANEWPAGVLHNMQARIIEAVADIRAQLPADHRMTPSPAVKAHVRDTGTSRHSIEGGRRLSDATDIFMDHWAHAYAAWEIALHHPGIGGLGFYLDKWIHSPGNSKPMLHFDGRDEKIFWVCYRGPNGDHYVYHHRNPERFHDLMSRREPRREHL